VQLPTLYKAKGLHTKSRACAICLDRTRGATQRVAYRYGVHVWLCSGHASPSFQRQRGGRDLVLTLTGLWASAGCLTASRRKAMDAHLASLRDRPARPRPGSYAWPRVRARAERLWSGGASLTSVTARVRQADYSSAEPPSRRTIQRWHSQRRWALAPP
jgi:hypothetical protein